MNKTRKNQLNAVVGILGTVKSALEQIHMEEEETLNNMSESAQDTERYMDLEDALDSLDDAIDALDEAIDAIESI